MDWTMEKLIAKLICAVMITGIVGCTANEIHEDSVVAEIVKDGGDPLTARCAILYTSTCALNAAIKK